MIIRVVGIETTGMDPAEGAEVIELSMQDVACQSDGTEARLMGVTHSWLYHPDRPSPPDVMAVHHILPEMLGHQDRFSQQEAEFIMDQRPDFYAAHNAGFERKFLDTWTARWICTYKCAMLLWPSAPSHGNQALMYWLGLHRTLETEERHPPHRAGPDAYVTSAILARLLEQGHSPEALADISGLPTHMPVCLISKFRGRPWSEVDHGFLTWYVGKAERTDPDTIHAVNIELARRRTERLRGGT